MRKFIASCIIDSVAMLRAQGVRIKLLRLTKDEFDLLLNDLPLYAAVNLLLNKEPVFDGIPIEIVDNVKRLYPVTLSIWKDGKLIGTANRVQYKYGMVNADEVTTDQA
jgi:hypothetical protein